VHDKSGGEYYERFLWVILIITIFGILSYISLNVNIVFSIAVGLLGAVLAVSYVAYFIYKNPPKENGEEAG
jgi:hypothetical protein